MAWANSVGNWSSASVTSSSKRWRGISIGIRGSPAGGGTGRDVRPRGGPTGRQGSAGALDAALHRGQAAPVLEQRAHLAVDLVRPGRPALLLQGVPGEGQLLRGEVQTTRVLGDLLEAQLGELGLLVVRL